jgi:hypothetical protein
VNVGVDNLGVPTSTRLLADGRGEDEPIDADQ